MKLTMADIEEIKDLMVMKLGTYRSRLLDVLESCRHPYNIYDVSNRISSYQSFSELQGQDLEELREVLKIRMDYYYAEVLAEIHSSEHPHELVEISMKLDKLLG